MSRFSRRSAAVLALAITACMGDSPVEAPLDVEVDFAIVDAANGGTVDGFFWETPTVKSRKSGKSDKSDRSKKSGKSKRLPSSFDPNFLSLDPTIQICQIGSDEPDGFAACVGPTLYTLSPSSAPPENIRVDLKGEHYISNWKNTDAAGIVVGLTYRAVVSVGGVTLGWVDMKATAKKKSAKKVGDGFVGLVVGKPFLFKFRVETGIPGSVVVTPPGQMIFDANTPGQSVDFTATVADLYANPLPGMTVDWSSSAPGAADVITPTGPTDGAGQTTTTASSDGLTPVSSPTDVIITAQVGPATGSETLLVKPSLGTLQVIKVSGADGTFDFTGSGSIGGDFQIATSGAPAATGMQSFNLLATSTYDLSETLNADFDFVSASCVLEGGGATGTPAGTAVTGIAVEPAKTTTCTFTNSLKPGSLTVIKNSDVDGSFDFTGDAGAFTLNTTGAPAATATQTFTGLDATVDVAIAETLNPSFDFVSAVCVLQGGGATGSGGPAVTGIDIEPGKTTTCTFTNMQKLGSLTVIKNSDADGSFDFTGSASIGAFTLVTVGQPNATAMQTFGSLDPNVTYDLSETLNPDFDLVSASCVLEGGGAAGTPGGTGVTGIVIEPGKTTTCTFANALKPGSLTVIKNSDADGSFDFTGSLGAFTLNTTGAPAATALQTFGGLDPSMTFDLAESANPAFDFQSVACVLQGGGPTGTPGAGTVTGVAVEPGRTTTCTFTNTAKTGSLTVIKNSDADGSFDFTGTPAIGPFSLNTTGGSAATATTTFTGLDASLTYDLTEASHPAFDLDAVSCVLQGGGATGTPGAVGVTGVTLVAGQTTTCTFDNSLKLDAVDDAYSATGNIGIQIPDGAADVIDSNDIASPGSSVSAVQGSTANVGVATATSNGGSVTLQADGSFTYEPPAGFEGLDAFTYTLVNAAATKTDVATVSITVSDMVWFIDGAAAGPGTGTFADPFKTVAAFNAANGLSGAVPDPKDGDIVSLASGAYNEADGVNLRNAQWLIGEAVQLATVFSADANSVAAYQAFATGVGAAPTLAASAGNGVDLGSGNTVRGLVIGNTSGTGMADGGSSVGTLTVSDVSITGTGRGFEADNGGTLAVSFGELSSSNAQGILIGGVGGAFSVASGTISSGGSTAVSITGTGTLTLGVSLTSVSANGAANGILLNNTAGAFTVTGDGSSTRNGSGGTIQNTTGDGVSLTSASGVTLRQMNLTNTGDEGIESVNGGSYTFTDLTIDHPAGHGWQATNLLGANTLDDSFIGDIDGTDHGIFVSNASANGTLNVTDTEFNDLASPGDGDDAIHFTGTGVSTMTLNVASVDGGFGASLFQGWEGNTIQAGGQGAAAGETVDMVVNVTGTRFQNATGSGSISLQPQESGSMTYLIEGNVLDNLANNPFSAAGLISIRCDDATSSSGHIRSNTIRDVDGLIGIDAIADDNCRQFDIEIAGNTIDDTFLEGMRIFLDGLGRTTAGITANVTVASNDVGVSQPVGTNSQEGIEIRAFRGLGAAASEMRLRMDGNRVTVNNFNDAVDIDAENDDVLQATITNNTFNNLAGGSNEAFDLESEKDTGAASTVCLNMVGNTTTSGLVHVEEEVGTTFSIQNLASIIADNPAMAITFLPNLGAFSAAGSCATPTLPSP